MLDLALDSSDSGALLRAFDGLLVSHRRALLPVFELEVIIEEVLLFVADRWLGWRQSTLFELLPRHLPDHLPPEEKLLFIFLQLGRRSGLTHHERPVLEHCLLSRRR